MLKLGLVVAILSLTASLPGCGAGSGQDAAVDVSAVCTFPSGRTCVTWMTCAGEGASACATCRCEVTGELSCFPRTCPADGGM